MFHNIDISIAERMKYLEERDARDRTDGTPHLQRLRQIPPEMGRFLALWAASAPRGALIEIGTSAGYSALWLSLAARAAGRRITTFEILPEKAALARETFRVAGVEEYVELVAEDARLHIADMDEVAFCFLDAEKEAYAELYELVIPRMVKGAVLIADNALSHQATLQPMIDRALNDERVDALVVPIGRGELVCRKT